MYSRYVDDCFVDSLFVLLLIYSIVWIVWVELVCEGWMNDFSIAYCSSEGDAMVLHGRFDAQYSLQEMNPYYSFLPI